MAFHFLHFHKTKNYMRVTSLSISFLTPHFSGGIFCVDFEQPVQPSNVNAFRFLLIKVSQMHVCSVDTWSGFDCILVIVWLMSAFWPGWQWWDWCSLAEIYLIRSAARRNIDVSLFDQNFLFQILQILHKIKVHQVESISFFDQFLKVNSWRWKAYDQNFLLQILEEEILI